MLCAAYARWLAENEPNDVSRADVVLAVLRVLSERMGRSVPDDLRLARMAAGGSGWALDVSVEACLESFEAPRMGDRSLLERRLGTAQVPGEVLDSLHGVESLGRRSGEETQRRSTGSYFTPRTVTRSLVDESLATEHLERLYRAGPVSVCDPAMGGGAFLLEAIVGLVGRERATDELVPSVLARVGSQVFGYDRNPVAVATAEAALWLLTDLADWEARLVCADSLSVGLRSGRGFDWLIGNPPWVSFQGRAAQKLDAERRAWLKATFPAFSGYPTLHGVFAERATELAPRGLISLLLPSSLSDLEGYRAARAAVVRTHVPHEPLLEYGQDAFDGVVQPCFGLLASPRQGPAEANPGRPWGLRERSRQGATIEIPATPAVLERLATLPKLPSACFGELGLQSNRRVSNELFLRAAVPQEPFVVPLLEGRNVRAFAVDAPRLFMNPDPQVLSESRCRFRPAEDYARVDFVVRQTAGVTIAARHTGGRFRNSLLAGYAQEDFDVDLLLGLLNSSLFKAFHASKQRDARQAAFPQVKVAHLRRLPAPPASPAGRARVRAASSALSNGDPSQDEVSELDTAVFELFDVAPAEQDEVVAYLTQRFPSRRQH